MSTRCRAGASLLSRRPLLGIITGLLLLSPPVHAAPHTVVRKAGDAWHVRTALCLTGKKVHGFLEQTWSPEGQLLSLALSLGESLLANSGVARLCQHVSEPWAGWQAVGRVQREAELEDFAEDRTCTVPDAPKRVRQQRELDDFRAMLRRLAYLEGRGIASLYGSNACRGEDGRQCLFDWTLVPDKVVQPPVRPVQPPLDRYFGRHTQIGRAHV